MRFIEGLHGRREILKSRASSFKLACARIARLNGSGSDLGCISCGMSHNYFRVRKQEMIRAEQSFANPVFLDLVLESPKADA